MSLPRSQLPAVLVPGLAALLVVAVLPSSRWHARDPDAWWPLTRGSGAASAPTHPALLGLRDPFLLVAALQPGTSRAAPDLREELLEEINSARAGAGAPPLRLAPALTRAAQHEAEEATRRGTISQGGARQSAQKELDEELRAGGYLAHEWMESVTATTGIPGQVVARWRDHDDGTWRRLMEPDFRDLGIGLSRLRGSSLYVFLYAVPEGEAFARATAGLRDLAGVRAELLAAVNQARRRAGLRSLAEDPRLDRAAQNHAEDMLARSYFSHRSPRGDTVRERAAAEGYPWRAIGENIAEGQQSVAEVLAGWLQSPAHRANLLDRDFTQLGSGLALGRDPRGGYRTLWVQAFGRPR